MLRSALLAVSLYAVSAPAHAVEVIPNPDYEFLGWSEKAMDHLCLRTTAAFLEKNVEGAENLQALDMPDYWSPEIADATIFMYPVIAIQSQLGEMNAAVTCIIPKSSNSFVELALSFKGEGILGFKKRRVPNAVGRVTFATFAAPLN